MTPPIKTGARKPIETVFGPVTTAAIKAVADAARPHYADMGAPDPFDSPSYDSIPVYVPAPIMSEISLQVFSDIEQGSDEWHDIRRGIVTASVVGLLITAKTVKPASNDTSRGLTASLAAERITGFTEPSPTSRDMERGQLDEPYAREAYSKHHAPAEVAGFMIRDDLGFQLGYSPDGLVGVDGLIEIKSRAQKKHLATILADEVPAENMAQIQCGLLVSGRDWCDYVSFCGGMKLWVKRVFPDPAWQAAIIEAVRTFERNAETMIDTYETATDGMPMTKRINHYLELELKL